VTWTEEPTDAEMHAVKALASRVSGLKGLSLTGVGVVGNWLARRVIPLKKHIHPGWKYCEDQDPTQEFSDNIEATKLIDHLKEVF
jgi:hypothetical protein